MNLVRKYKISKFINKPLEGNEGEIISLIKYWLADLYAVKLDKYPNSIFYFKGDKYVLEDNNDLGYTYVRWKEFWEVLNTKYLMSGVDIQIILKFMIEEAFKEKVKTPRFAGNGVYTNIEESFKEDVKPPKCSLVTSVEGIEEAFKGEVKTPDKAYTLDAYLIEEAFKQQIKTPQNSTYRDNKKWVEETLKELMIKQMMNDRDKKEDS